MNVALDYLDPSRDGQARALELFDLQRNGDVELIIAPQGHRADAPTGRLEEQIKGLVREGVLVEAEQVARISKVTEIPFVIGRAVPGFWEACNDVIATWKTHEGKPPGDDDRWHVETHILAGADEFVTNDRPLRNMCRRLTAEHGISIHAVSVEDYLAGRGRTGTRTGTSGR